MTLVLEEEAGNAAVLVVATAAKDATAVREATLFDSLVLFRGDVRLFFGVGVTTVPCRFFFGDSGVVEEEAMVARRSGGGMMVIGIGGREMCVGSPFCHDKTCSSRARKDLQQGCQRPSHFAP